MKTKSYVRFLNRAAHFDADLELADVFKIAIEHGALTPEDDKLIFNYMDSQHHPRLAARKRTNSSRIHAVTHLNETLFASYLKDIYEDTTQYFNEILEAAARHGIDHNRLVGEHKVTFDANKILDAGSWNKVVHLVSQSIFRRLEGEKSTKDLMKAINDKLNLGVTQATLDAALPYFEIRHLLVHSDGEADQKFCTAFPSFGATVGQKIVLDHSVLQNARAAILALINEFDQNIVTKNVIAASEIRP